MQATATPVAAPVESGALPQWIRILPLGKVELVEGKELAITTDEGVLGTAALVSTTYPHLAADVNVGDRILLDDGLLEVRSVGGTVYVRTALRIGNAALPQDKAADSALFGQGMGCDRVRPLWG